MKKGAFAGKIPSKKIVRRSYEKEKKSQRASDGDGGTKRNAMKNVRLKMDRGLPSKSSMGVSKKGGRGSARLPEASPD